MHSKLLQEFRNNQADEFAQRLRAKIEQETQHEIEAKIRAQVFDELTQNGELEAMITNKLAVNFEKKLAQERRKMKLESQEREKELQEQLMKQYESLVKEKAIALT